MNKSELVEALANSSGVTKADAGRVLNALVSTVTDVLKNGEQVVVPGLGTYCVGHRSEREGRNPQTGAKIKIEARRIAKFKAAKALRDAVQE